MDLSNHLRKFIYLE